MAQDFPYEEPAAIVFDFTFAATTAGAPQDSRTDFGVNIDKDADFFFMRLYGLSDGEFFFNFKMPRGKPFANAPIKNRNCIGTLQNPAYIGPTVMYRSGSRIPIDLINNFGGSQNQVQLVFSGIRRYNT